MTPGSGGAVEAADSKPGAEQHRTGRTDEAHVQTGEGQLTGALLLGRVDLCLNDACGGAVALLDRGRGCGRHRGANSEPGPDEYGDRSLPKSHARWSPYHV